MNKIFLDSGYLNFDYIIGRKAVYNFIVGGRGIGKTYGAIKWALEHHVKFIFLRRTAKQLAVVAKRDLSPFKKLIADGVCGEILTKHLSEDQVAFVGDDGGTVAYGMALSTISNVRGFDASDVELIIYDEFIPERHERPIKDECDALLNAYETINRNRELEGGEPVRLLALSNSNNIANPVFMGLRLVAPVTKLIEQHRDLYENRNRSLLICNMSDSPISQKKSETALYRLAGKDSDFARMSLGNEYAHDEPSRQAHRNLKEYTPVVHVGDISIYLHKSKPEYYVSQFHAGGAPEYSAGSVEIKRFQRAYSHIWIAYLNDRIEFESYTAETIFQQYFKQ